MCSVAAASIAAVVGSALAQGIQNDRNLSPQADAARENAKRADAARGDAYFRANEQVGQIQRQYTAAEDGQKTAMASSGFSKKNSSPSRSRSTMSERTCDRNSSTPFHGRGMFWPRMRPARRRLAADK